VKGLPVPHEKKLDVNFVHDATKNSNVGLNAKLTSFFKGLFSSSSTSYVLIKSLEVETWLIRNPGEIVRDLVAQEGTQAWVDARHKEKKSLYLITGLKIAKNASAKFGSSRERVTEAEATVPVSAIATGIPSETLDVGVGASTGQKSTSKTSLVAVGERVIAVQYHKLQYKIRQLAVKYVPPAADGLIDFSYENYEYEREIVADFPDTKNSTATTEEFVGPVIGECYDGKGLEDVADVEIGSEDVAEVEMEEERLLLP
jgi:hypothetical protein